MHPTDPYENLESAATSEGVPVAPSMGPLLDRMRLPVERTLLDARVVLVCALSVGLAVVAGLAAQMLFAVIQLVTNAAFFGRLSLQPVSPADSPLGWPCCWFRRSAASSSV